MMRKLPPFLLAILLVMGCYSMVFAESENSENFKHSSMSVLDNHENFQSESFTGGTLSVTISSFNATCNNSNGGATASASGGSGAITYLWSNSTSGATATNLAPGAYTVTATDGVGATATSIAVINGTSIPEVAITGSNTTCGSNTGMATASVTGGISPFSYSWSNGGSTATITGLSSGTYFLTVMDALGCSGTSAVEIGQSIGELSVSVTTTDATCLAANGTASASVSGSSGAVTYTWSDAGISGSMATGLTAGTYIVTATDAGGCMGTATATVGQINITLSVNATATDATCTSGGSASASSSGGSGAISYTWSNNATGATATDLSADAYTVTATDANGCTGTTTVVVGQNILSLSVNANATDATCMAADGMATASTSGGSGTILYTWSNSASGATATGLTAGAYTVTATDANGCTGTTAVVVGQNIISLSVNATTTDATCLPSNGTATASTSGGSGAITYVWSNNATGATASSLPIGAYTVTATDANGCTGTTTVVVGQNIISLSVNATATDATCLAADGTATASTSGGSGAISYAWSNSASGATATGLPVGAYTVTATDANGCTGTATVSVGQNMLSLSVNATATDATCLAADGTATASTSGGSGAISYAWSNSASGATATGLPVGTYTVTATDANGCTGTATVSVGQNMLSLSVNATATDATCLAADGTATASTSGGSGAISYTWSNSASGATATNLPAGTYTVTATDGNGCTGTATATVSSSTSNISLDVTTTTVTCYGDSDGSATVTVLTGTGPFTYIWSEGSTTATITGIPAGTYTVTVTDANGCTGTESATVNNPNNSTQYEWIETINLNDLTNQSGDDGGYGDYCALTANVSTGESYTMTLTPGYSGATYLEAWRVYIDFNQDGVFSFSERVVQIAGFNSLYPTLHIPHNAMTGTTKMRIVMGYNWYNTPCGSGFEGEIEDYSIQINACSNVIDGGLIEADETLCPTMDDPSAMTNVSSPSGGIGTLEYVWLMNTTTSSPPPAAGWVEIPNSNAPTYDPGPISETTWYIRCARRAGCTQYWGESNVVEKTFNQNCNGPSYCSSAGMDTQYEWIHRVKLKNVNNTSGDDGGYGDYTNLVVSNFKQGQSRKISLWPGFSGNAYREYWRVWVDWNQDGDFDDPGELEGQGSGYGKMTGYVSAPHNATVGQTRMRVSMKYGSYANSCELFAEGEVEDYTIDVTPSNAVYRSETPSKELISEINSGIQVKAYPNPAIDLLTLDYQLPIMDAVTISVFDITGKSVLLREIKADAPRRKIELNVSHLASGSYVVQIISSKHNETVKFIKK